MKKIKLLRYRNIRLTRHEAGSVLTIGKDITEAQAETLVRIGNAEWVKAKKAPQNKAAKPAKETK